MPPPVVRLPQNRDHAAFLSLRRLVGLMDEAAATAEDSREAALPVASSTDDSSGGDDATAAVVAAPTPSSESALVVTGSEESILDQIARDYLQCPVCLDALRTKPIYQCRNGHTICNACILQLDSCPLCRASILGYKVRNMALEVMMDNVKATCPYKKKGCLEMVKTSMMKQHVIDCKFGKFVLCPSLGFENCREIICSETWSEHVATKHQVMKTFKMAAESCTMTVTYWDFISTKTIKEGGLLKWEPVVISPFRDAGPFVIHCQLDMLKNCTATFACIYAPPKLVEHSDLWDEEQSQKFFVEFSIEEDSFMNNDWKLPVKISWVGETMLHSEYQSGSPKGQFKVPLGFYTSIFPDNTPRNATPPANVPLDGNSAQPNAAAVPENVSVDGNLSVIGASAAALSRLPLQNNANAENGGAGVGLSAVAPAFAPPRQQPIRRYQNEKLHLRVKVRFVKKLEDLKKPLERQIQVNQRNYTIIKPATFPRVKCDECKEGPLRGTRYRCMECLKFDLCHRCMNNKEIHTHHVFMCIRSSQQNSRVTKNFKRIYREGPLENGDYPSHDENEESVAAPVSKRVRKTPTPTAPRNSGGASVPVPSSSSATSSPTASSIRSPSPNEGIPIPGTSGSAQPHVVDLE